MYSSYSHHDIIVVVFANFDDADQPTLNPATITDGMIMGSAQDAYREVARTMPAAYRAIVVPEEEWPMTNGIFTIGGGTATDNPPLRTGFIYRAFIRTYSAGNAKVCYYTNILLVLSLIYYREMRGSLAHLQLALIIQLSLKIQVSYQCVCVLAYHCEMNFFSPTIQ